MTGAPEVPRNPHCCAIIDLDNDLVPTRQHAIIWVNDGKNGQQNGRKTKLKRFVDNSSIFQLFYPDYFLYQKMFCSWIFNAKLLSDSTDGTRVLYFASKAQRQIQIPFEIKRGLG